MFLLSNFHLMANFILTYQPETSIKEVAQQLNFPEQFTFRKYFKQHTGMSPSDYRDMHGRE